MSRVIKINEIILDVIKDYRLPENVVITDKSNLRGELNFDSLALASLTVRIEEEFDIDIFEHDNIQTVGEIYKVIGRG